MKKQRMRDRRPSRRAERVVESAQLEARAILAEARADAALERLLSTQQTQAEIDRLCELAAERVRAASTALVEQFRREAFVARDEARRELDAERTRWRDEALLDAATIREHAREEVATLLARIADEHRALIGSVHEDVQRLASGAVGDARIDRTLDALRQTSPAVAADSTPAPEAARIDSAVEALLQSQAASATSPDPAGTSASAVQTEMGAVPVAWTVEALADTREAAEAYFGDASFKDFWNSSVGTWSHGDGESRSRMRRRRRSATSRS